MNDAILKLREQRRELVAAARELNEKVLAEERQMTDEESGQFDDLMDKAQAKLDEAETLERQESRSQRLATAEAELEKSHGRKVIEPIKDAAVEPESGDEEMRRFELFLKAGSPELRKDLMPEIRALQADADIYGGYTIAPEQFIRRLLKGVDDALWFRGAATIFTLTESTSMGVPTLDADPDDATWTAEIGAVSFDSSMAFGRRSLEPHQLAKAIKISEKLLRVSALPIESIVRQRMTYKMSRPLENTYFNGTGAGQPLGIFTASADGITTSEDVSTGNTTTAITADGLKECKYSLNSAYWPGARWMFHLDAVKMIAKLKDGEGRYLWTDSIVNGEPERLLGFPISTSVFVPNTFTSTQYVGCLGDLSYYWIADSLAMNVKRLDELYAANFQVGFRLNLETDGMPVMSEAFKRVKLA